VVHHHLTPQNLVWFVYWNRVIHHHHIPHMHIISICMEDGSSHQIHIDHMMMDHPIKDEVIPQTKHPIINDSI
jgi:hypothetical protein